MKTMELETEHIVRNVQTLLTISTITEIWVQKCQVVLLG